MDCRTFHRKLEDYLEAGLDFAGRFGMERHAKQCYACERTVNDALKLRQMARDLRRVAAPEDFEAAVLARIEAEKSRRLSWRLQTLWLYHWDNFSWRTAGASAMLVFLTAGGISLLYYQAGLNRSAPQRSAGIERSADPLVKMGNSAPAVDAEVASQDRPSLSEMRGPVEDAFPVTINNSGLRIRDDWATPYTEPGDSDFVELLVPVSGDRHLILQLPRIIRMRYAQPSRDHFIRNVSH